MTLCACAQGAELGEVGNRGGHGIALDDDEFGAQRARLLEGFENRNEVSGRRADEYVLFSAHYDHVGIRPGAEPDSIFNGANDDASGTTAVVALAEYFKQMGTPERTLLLGTPERLTIATLNVENLGGDDSPSAFAARAAMISVGKRLSAGSSAHFMLVSM